MSGHSKWSKIKHQKETTDSAKGKIFTKLANAIIIAVKQGGGITDPDDNMKLRFAVEKARQANMPRDKIDRAIERGGGKGIEDNLEEAVYEGFGPAGVGIMIETAGNNRQRTVADLKNILERHSGRLATSGSVAHFFQNVGQVTVAKGNRTYDEVMEKAIDAGAIDLEDANDTVEIYTQHSDLHQVKEALAKNGLIISSFELIYRPNTTVLISDRNVAKKILGLLSSLEDMDDVQKVYANFDIPDEFIQ